MRRYFPILVVAMATLLLSACEFASGDTADPQKANKLLWSRVNDGLYLEYEYIQPVAHLNDLMLGKEYASKAYGDFEMTELNGEYTITYFYGGTLTKAVYSIVTDGKRLNEGGQWDLYISSDRTVSSMQYVGTAKGFEGEDDKFRFTTGNPEWSRYSFFVAQQSEINYSYNEAKRFFNMTMSITSGLNTDYLPDPSAADYSIEYESAAPLVWESGAIISGKLNLLYNDTRRQHKRTLSVEVVGIGDVRFTDGR